MRTRWRALILVCLSALSAHADPKRMQPPAAQAAHIAVTTSRPDARKLFESGMVEFENEHISRAMENWRTAIKKDPSFALAHLFISEATSDPVEQKTERLRAKALACADTPSQRVLIKCPTAGQEPTT